MSSHTQQSSHNLIKVFDSCLVTNPVPHLSHASQKVGCGIVLTSYFGGVKMREALITAGVLIFLSESP